jgi:hypothetical protein
MADSFENGNEMLGSIRSWEFDKLNFSGRTFLHVASQVYHVSVNSLDYVC